MQTKTKPTVSKLLHPAGLGKRVLSFFIDLAFTGLLAILLYATVGQLLIINNSDYYEQKAIFRDNTVATHLAYEFYCDDCKSYFDPDFMSKSGDEYVDPNGHVLEIAEEPISFTMKDDEGNWLDKVKLNNVEMHPYQLYETIIWRYYTEYLPTEPAFADERIDGKTYAEYYTPEYLVKEVYGIKPNLEGNPILDDSMWYEPAKDSEDHWNYAAQPVLRTSKGDVSSKEVRDAVATYFNSSNSGLYVTTLTNLKGQSIYTDPIGKMNVTAYLALMPSVILPSLIFLFIIPLCLGDGRTLGKLFLKLAVVGFDGYKAKPISKIVRYFFVLIGFEILLIPFTAAAFMLMMLYFALGYMILVMSKTSQALHDKVASTIVVDAKTSLWFVDEDSKEDYIATHPSSLAAKMTSEDSGKPQKAEGEITRVLVSDSMPTPEESGVLDLSTIAKFHEETDKITSFDEFEKKNEEKQAEEASEDAFTDSNEENK